MLRSGFTIVVLLLASMRARGSVTVLVGEPFGSFGTMMPSGHTTIYLDRVCAQTPTSLRMCQPGEPAGVALARYDHLGDVDWIATPILPFLYATSDAAAMLPYATPQQLGALRESYRRDHLELVFPDSDVSRKRDQEWVETLGVAYVRRLYGYRLDTTEEQDAAVIATLNAQPDRHRYRLHGGNCADFVANILNTYYPGTVEPAGFANFFLLSPKQVARSVARLVEARPDLHPSTFVVEQVPGSLRRSRPVRFAAEALLKQKRYALTLAVIQPEALIALYAMYRENGGDWRLGAGAQVVTAREFLLYVSPETPQAKASARSNKDCS